MINTNYIYRLILVGAIVFFSSCEKVIEFDIPEAEPLLVVNSFISNGEQASFQISSSKSYLESGELDLISGAQINLSGNGNVLEVLESEDDPGHYFSVDTIVDFGTYEVTVSHPSFNMVSASTELLSSVSGNVEFISEDGGDLEYSLKFNDVTNSEDYYHIIIIEENEEFGFSQVIGFTSNDEVLISAGENSGIGEENYFYLNGFFKDILFEDGQASIEFKINQPIEGSDYKVQLIRSNRDYFEYHQSIEAYYNSDGIFTQPVQVYSNIENGIGVFGAFSLEELNLE